MAAILFKWFLSLSLVVQSLPATHPIYVSVTHVSHNSNEKILEISSKILTDDFEKALRMSNTAKIDLLDAKMHSAMLPVVKDYLTKHLHLFVNEKPVQFRFLGFEQDEEGIISYLQVDNVPAVKTITVLDNILYEYKTEQISILHVTVNGERKSTKMNNPEAKAVFNF